MANLALYKINMKGLKTHPPIHNNHMETSWCRSYHHCMSAIWKEWSLTSYQQVLSVSSCSTLEFRHYTLWKNLYWWNISIEIRWMFLKVNLNGIWEPQIGFKKISTGLLQLIFCTKTTWLYLPVIIICSIKCNIYFDIT